MQLELAIREIKALDHCGVIRAPIDHAGFRAAFDQGYAEFREVEDRYLDYFLTAEGRKIATIFNRNGKHGWNWA